VTKKSGWRLILLGFGFLLLSAYLDNLRGILLPVFTQVFGLTHQQNSSFLVLGNFASVFFTLSLLFLTRRFSDRAVCIGVCVSVLGSLSYALKVSAFPSLLIFSVLIGGMVSMLGSLANLNVIHGSTLTDRAKSLCGLHAMYGLGSLCAPEIAKRLFAAGDSWTAPVFAAIPAAALLLFGSFAMPARRDDGIPEVAVSVNSMQVLILAIFAVYVAGEVMASMWMASYLVDFASFSVVEVAPYVTGFFLTMAITRLLCFFSLKPAAEVAVLFLSLIGSSAFFILAYSGKIWAFPLVGVLGPFFPLFLSRLGKTFPKSVRALTLWILASNQLTQACFHLVVGGLADHLGIRTAYGLPLWLLLGCLGLLGLYLRREKSYRPKLG